MPYRTIVIDPPWPETMIGRFHSPRHSRADRLPYPTLPLSAVAALPVPDLAAASCHLWVWTTNRTVPDGYELMRHWGFKFLAPVHWVKPSGFGAWFVHRSQTVLFGYRGKLDMRERYRPNVLFAPAGRHSTKPDCAYRLAEAVGHPDRLDMFARTPRPGWHVWGNEVDSDVAIRVGRGV